MMEAEAAGDKSMMEAEAGTAEAEIMLLSPSAEAEIIELVPLLKARIFPRARSLIPYKHIILYLELSSHSRCSWATASPSREGESATPQSFRNEIHDRGVSVSAIANSTESNP